jgi:protein SCO1/2
LVGGAAEKTKAAELLLLAFSEEPDHPGIDHYLIFCLGHAAYQPKPFEKAPSATPAQRISLAVFALFALGALGIFVTLTADLRPGASNARSIGGPFVLTAPNGTTVTDQTFRDRWMLVYFGYTRCLDVCPTVLRAIAQLIEKLDPSGACVQPIFISFDPERDTPKAVGEFTKAFSPRIIGLTGTPDEVAAVARQYRVFPRRIPCQQPDDYRIEHFSSVYVIGPDSRFVTLFSPEHAKDPDGMYSQLRGLLSPSGQYHEEDSAAKISMMTAVHPQDRLAAAGQAK